MDDSQEASPSKFEPKARRPLTRLQSQLAASAEPEASDDLLSESANISQTQHGSSSSEDVERSEDGDESRRSMEPDVQPEDSKRSPLHNQTITRRNSGLAEQEPLAPQRKNQTLESAPLATQRNESKFHLWASFVALLLVVIGFVVAKSLPSAPAKRLHCDGFITQLRPKYPTVDPTLWSTLNVSVNRAFYRDPGEPSTFMFLYDSVTISKSLVEDIIGVTSKCFGETEPIRLTSADFPADYAEFLQQYRKPLEEHGIMLVQDLDQVPAKAARALFTICDSYGPLVNRAVIFLTIDISRRSNDLENSPTEIAESLLHARWRDGLRQDTLQPLLVRLTENVFKII